MTNVIDYLRWRGDISFDQEGINIIDSLIFTELSYLPFEEIVPSPKEHKSVTIEKVGELFFEKYNENKSIGAIIPGKEIIGLLKETVKTARFKDVNVWGYVNIVNIDYEKQFSAICFNINKKVTYVAYRGTDDTIIGWKENFNMAIFTPIPSQKDGAEYLDCVAKSVKNSLYIGGHSKGGNLAIYSALFSNEKTKERIVAVDSFDGPGFQQDFVRKAREDALFDKITTTVPDSSTVGMIFDMVGKANTVKSHAKGLKQHDAFSWEVLGNQFVPVNSLSKSAKEFHILLKKWVSNMTEDEIKEFVSSLYKVFTSNQASTLSDINADKGKFIISVLKSDDKTKKTILSAIQKLLKQRISKKNKTELKEEEEKEFPKE